MKPNEFPTQIAAIETGGGGSVAGVHYVTFIGADGTELYKRPVADGDDCADIVARGLISTPTKESTVSQTFTYSGWSFTEGGETNSAALANVTEDRTVYAVFTASVRHYTITYYDSDGTTVLKTASLAYGSNPNYMPEKEGHSFVGWTPETTNVEGDASYTAAWIEAVSFASGSWADIAEVCENGEAANHFKVGDTRIEPNGDNTFEFRIIGINLDEKADGSGKAGITIAVSGANRTLNTMQWEDASNNKWESVAWSGGQQVLLVPDIRIWLRDTFFATLPTQLQSIIKTINKTTTYMYEGRAQSVATTETVFIPSTQEISAGWKAKNTSYTTDTEPMGQYPYLGTTENRIFYNTDGAAINWWTRTTDSKTAFYVSKNGSCGDTSKYVQTNDTHGVLPCFCI